MPFSLHKARHTYPYAPTLAHHKTLKRLLVYLRLMIVSITVSKVLVVLVVLDVLDVAGGGGSVLPVIGTLPAKIEVDSTHVSTRAVASFFMVL